jgi:hypothetical protein
MACRSCGSEHQTELDAEVNLHFFGRRGLDQPHLLACTKLIICLGCGLSQGTLATSELPALRECVRTPCPSP